MSLLCMCFQYFVPNRGLRTLGTRGKVRGSFGNYLANLKTISHQMVDIDRVHPGHKLFCLVVCTDHLTWVRARTHCLCAVERPVIKFRFSPGGSWFGFLSHFAVWLQKRKRKGKKKVNCPLTLLCSIFCGIIVTLVNINFGSVYFE